MDDSFFTAKEKKKASGGNTNTILVIFLLLLSLGRLIYFLNKYINDKNNINAKDSLDRSITYISETMY